MKTTRRLVPSLALALALALAAMFPAAGSASPRWVPVSPFGGPLDSVARSLSSPRIVYAADPFGGVFRSSDGAATWIRLAGPNGGRIADLLVDPEDPNTVFILAGGRLLRTKDGGQNWSSIGAGLPEVNAVSVEAHPPGGFLAATFSGLYRSSDGGDHWTLTAFSGLPVAAVAADLYAEGNLLAALGRPDLGALETVWRSTDHGLTWAIVPLSNVSSGVTEDQPHFVFDAARPGTVYTFYGRFGGEIPGAIFRSTDGGATWVQPSTTDVQELVSTADGTLFATAGFGVIRSTDRGDTWEALGTGIGLPADRIAHLAASSAHPDAVLATGTHGLWKSVDAGAHWRESNRGIPVPAVNEVAVSPNGPRDVLAVAGGRVFRSQDRGATWQRVHSEFDAVEPYAIIYDPRPSGNIYGVAFDGQAAALLYSGDRGNTWTPRPFPYTCGGSSACDVTFNTFALDASHPDTLYVSGSYFIHFGGHGPFFLRSRDGGMSWESLRILPDLNVLFVDPLRSRVLYGLTPRRLYKSEDGAGTWRIVGRGLPPRGRVTLAIDPRNSLRLFAGTSRGVYTSGDGGLTFQAMNAGIERVRVGKILLDPSNPDRLYAAAAGAGVFRWDRRLRRWTPLNDGLPVQQFFETLALDPRDSKTLYAGTFGSGLLRLDLAESP